MYNKDVKSFSNFLFRILLLGLLCFALPSLPMVGPGASPVGVSVAWAQDPEDDLTDADYAEMGEAGPMVREMRQGGIKYVTLIFDISGSMRANGMMKRARQAAVNIVNNGVKKGDSVRLLMFGPTYTMFERTINSGADRKEVLDKIPFEPGADAGTNIRRPHAEALKNLDQANWQQAYIILLTDSFNDEPRTDNPAYKDYKKYYVPGQLQKYPKTPENTAYEGLLKKLVQSGRVKQFGIGVEIAPNGRPVERRPQDAPAPVATPIAAPVDTAPPAAPPNLTWLWLLLGVGVVGGAALVIAPLLKPVAVRISGAGNPKDFQISGSQTIRIGGDGANFAPDAFPIPGVTTPLATIRSSGGKMTLIPAAPPSNEKGQVRVYHNGLPLEAPSPLMYGDEVKVTVPQAGGVPKDYRLKFSDPRAT